MLSSDRLMDSMISSRSEALQAAAPVAYRTRSLKDR